MLASKFCTCEFKENVLVAQNHTLINCIYRKKFQNVSFDTFTSFSTIFSKYTTAPLPHPLDVILCRHSL